jgi:hypothetical protein
VQLGIQEYLERLSSLSDATLSIELNYKILKGGSHPAHIHLTLLLGGAIALTKQWTDHWKSNTTFKHLMMAVPYQALLAFDGYINVHLSADKLSTLLQGDIGQNDLTGFLKFSFGKCCCSTLSGTATFTNK